MLRLVEATTIPLLLALCLPLQALWGVPLRAAESEPTWVGGAKREGELVVWAVGEIQFQTMVVDRFKKNYPFMRRVDAVRIPSEKLRTRLLTEAQTGKKSSVDVMGLGGGKESRSSLLI